MLFLKRITENIIFSNNNEKFTLKELVFSFFCLGLSDTEFICLIYLIIHNFFPINIF